MINQLQMEINLDLDQAENDQRRIDGINQKRELTLRAIDDPTVDVSNTRDNFDPYKLTFNDFERIVYRMLTPYVGRYTQISLEQLNDIFRSGQVVRFDRGDEKYQYLTRTPNVVFLTYVFNKQEPYLTIAQYDASKNELLPLFKFPNID